MCFEFSCSSVDFTGRRVFNPVFPANSTGENRDLSAARGLIHDDVTTGTKSDRSGRCGNLAAVLQKVTEENDVPARTADRPVVANSR